ncbi:MAG: hypothetical protein GX601_05355 [Anaerolineales bacterium]|nr:hypothetical protein [Anaerolineales bacterium]
MEITDQERLQREMEAETGLSVYPRSLAQQAGISYGLAHGPQGKELVILGATEGFEGQRLGRALLGPTSASNATRLRECLPWLRPQPLGIVTSVGCGDRLGLATPGHVRAVRTTPGIAPIFAQQSIRENARTGRTPAEVIDDAMWGVLQEGWRAPWGADADHIKNKADLDSCIDCGYTFYTFDPGDWVDNAAHTAPLEVLRTSFAALPWWSLEDAPDGLLTRYLGREFHAGDFAWRFDEADLLRAACKYGAALAHAVGMVRHLARRLPAHRYEVELSVDETETPTSPLEHLFIASELQRLEVHPVSLAPRYVGRFEKGVDYIGDVEAFAAEVAQHAAIARAFGPYKLSLHSGSDKFTVYPLVARYAGELAHLKTAGTSYLEAIRAIAHCAPALFCTILDFARGSYPADRASYHVSAEVERVPEASPLQREALPGLLDQFDARQVLHVTFGSVLDAFGTQIKQVLADHEEAHYAALEAHFRRHLAPFAAD